MFEDMLSSLFNFIGEFLVSSGVKVIGALLIVIIGFKITNVIVKKTAASNWFSKIDVTVQSFFKSFIGILLKVIVIISAAILLGVPSATMLATIGSAGLAIGLALQGGLANIAGGLILMVFKPFKVGDYIESGSISGTVHSIDIFHTVIMTPDKKKITVPNGELSNSSVTNYSSEPKRRVDFQLTVASDSDIDFVRKVLLAAAANHSLVITGDEEFPSVVYVTGHKDASIQLSLRVWCESPDYWAVYFDLTEDIKKAFNQFNIVIPYPQLEVHIDK